MSSILTFKIPSTVSRQCGRAGLAAFPDRVEEVLKAQNDLTADYGVELIARSLMQNTVTFSLRAVPKTYVDGMTAAFLADCGNGPIEFPTDAAPNAGFYP